MHYIQAAVWNPSQNSQVFKPVTSRDARGSDFMPILLTNIYFHLALCVCVARGGEDLII